MPEVLSCRPWLLRRKSEADEGDEMERRVLGGTVIGRRPVRSQTSPKSLVEST